MFHHNYRCFVYTADAVYGEIFIFKHNYQRENKAYIYCLPFNYIMFEIILAKNDLSI